MTGTALASLLPLPVALPIAGAVAAPLLARLHRQLAVIVGLVALAGSTAILLLEAPSVFTGLVRAHYLGLWTPVHGRALGIAFAADPFGLIFALTSAVIGAVLLLYTLSELGGLGPRELGGYACLFQLVLAALIGAALTADLINLFVWFEVAALASYGLTAFFLERPIALEAAFKILALTTLASFAVFIGAGLLYAATGALNFGQLHDALARHLSTPDLIALGLLVAGFATKAGLVPFHGWLADVHTATSGPVSALFSGLMYNFGIVAIGRLAFQVFGRDAHPDPGPAADHRASSPRCSARSWRWPRTTSSGCWPTTRSRRWASWPSGWAPAPRPGSRAPSTTWSTTPCSSRCCSCAPGPSCTAPG